MRFGLPVLFLSVLGLHFIHSKTIFTATGFSLCLLVMSYSISNKISLSLSLSLTPCTHPHTQTLAVLPDGATNDMLKGDHRDWRHVPLFSLGFSLSGWVCRGVCEIVCVCVFVCVSV